MHRTQPTFAPQPLPPDRRPAKGIFAKAVGSFVPKLTAKAFERFGFHSAEILAAWPRIVGNELAAQARPERIKWPRPSGANETGTLAGGATLVLRVAPGRALDVAYGAAEIIDRINRYFGYRAVAQIRIIQAPLGECRGEPAQLAESGSQADGTRHAATAAAEGSEPAGTGPELAAALAGLRASIAAERWRR